jgi:hypothetical protein
MARWQASRPSRAHTETAGAGAKVVATAGWALLLHACCSSATSPSRVAAPAALQARVDVEVDRWFRPAGAPILGRGAPSPRPEWLQDGCKHVAPGLATSGFRPDWRPRPASRRQQG